MNYRIGIRTQRANECLIQVTDAKNIAEAGQLIGQRVIWKSENMRHAGRIVGLHGKNGVLIARFKKGVPGQALGATVEIVVKKA